MIIYNCFDSLLLYHRMIDGCEGRLLSKDTALGLLFGPCHSLHAKYVFRNNKDTGISVCCLVYETGLEIIIDKM